MATGDSDTSENARVSVFGSRRQIRSPLFLMKVGHIGAQVAACRADSGVFSISLSRAALLLVTAMFDTELFINEVHERTPLWNMKHRDLANRDVKSKLWIEVAVAVVERWDVLTNEEKNEQVKDLQIKWKSVRDAFSREVRLQKATSGSGQRTRKRCMYFDQLLFLLDSIEDRITSTNIHNEAASIEEDEGDVETGDTSTPVRHHITQRGSKRKVNTFEEQVLEHLKTSNAAAEDDGDRLFLLSLLPMFKKLNDESNLWARLRMTEVMQQALRSNTQSITDSQSTPLHAPSFGNCNQLPATFIPFPYGTHNHPQPSPFNVLPAFANQSHTMQLIPRAQPPPSQLPQHHHQQINYSSTSPHDSESSVFSVFSDHGNNN